MRKLLLNAGAAAAMRNSKVLAMATTRIEAFMVATGPLESISDARCWSVEGVEILSSTSSTNDNALQQRISRCDWSAAFITLTQLWPYARHFSHNIPALLTQRLMLPTVMDHCSALCHISYQVSNPMD